MGTRLQVYGVDIGSPSKGKFAWARPGDASPSRDSADPATLASVVACDLRAGKKVALGFECPLYIPIAESLDRITAARDFESDRAWSATAGATAALVGLAEVTWLLRRIRESAGSVSPYLSWSAFRTAPAGLFLWEAFVTHQQRRQVSCTDHRDWLDARRAARAFLQQSRCWSGDPERASDVLSLVGAALLHAGWSTDLPLLRVPCRVVPA